ncbi:cytochrome C [Spiribacter roseus]|uniref:c-type cytochrome n=1 Tax=Spiribacter roseus TaxID=1855875 RepID=UPI000F720DCC|nr:cytochrome C [Spiribacter roseus]
MARRETMICGRLIGGVALSAALLMPGLGSAQGDIEAGRAKAYTCLGCHAVEGYRNAYPSYRVPKLGGQHAGYLVSSLKAYRSGARQHTTMQALASTLSDEDIQDIAAYFASRGPEGQ